MAYVLQVNTDLMGAAGVQFQPEEVHHFESRDNDCIGLSHSAPRRYGHPLSVMLVSGDGRFDPE